MKKFPVICPPGSIIKITQGFQPVENPTHNAVDFTIWNPLLTERENWRLSYGTQLVVTDKSKCVHLNDFGTMNPLGNGIDMEWREGEFYYELHFWHTVYNNYNVGDVVEAGSVVALMGNTGDCRPAPTELRPYDGCHCHMAYIRYRKNEWGGNYEITYLDPTLFFDILNPYTGNDSSILVDVEPLKWAWNKLGITDNFSKLLYMINNIFNK